MSADEKLAELNESIRMASDRLARLEARGNASSVIATIAIVIAVFASLTSVGLFMAGEPAEPRYTGINAGDGRVYKVDRQTGETSLVQGNREVNVQKDSVQAPDARRSLTPEEVSKLTGRGGPTGNYSFFSGNLYNGNESIRVTEVTITFTRLGDVPENQVSYKKQVTIAPQATSFILLKVMPGDISGRQWSITEAKGQDIQ